MNGSRRQIRLNYFRRRPNFGDLLSPVLVESLFGEGRVEHSEAKDADLLAAGSLFGRGDGVFFGDRPKAVCDGVTTHVWGTGVKEDSVPSGPVYRYFDLKIHAVRGRLTESVFRRAGYIADDEHPALGDPGLLYPDLLPDWRSVPKSYDVAVVPHYYDQAQGRRLVSRLRDMGVDARFVDVSDLDPLKVLREIAAARKVVSSSLHGLIVADAMGIPNRRLVFGGHGVRETAAISDFKFRDYYSAFGRDAPSAIASDDVFRDPSGCLDSVGDAAVISCEEVEAGKIALRMAFESCREAMERRSKGLSVLMVKNPPREKDGSGKFFVPTLQSILKPLGHRVDSSVREFWHPTRQYDIVHVHWPQLLFPGKGEFISDSDVMLVRRRLAEFKKHGTSIVYTRHNEIPHYCRNPHEIALCRLFEDESDRVIHMGRFSLRQMTGARGERDVVIPHHGFDWYPVSTLELARKELVLSPSDRVMSVVGVYRDDEERELVVRACCGSGISGLRLVSPAVFSEIRGCASADTEHYRERLAPFYPRQPEGWVSEEDMCRCISAADVVFLQRVHTLNSGNLPLAFHFGKVVVGPDRGNVGEILRETGNPVFDPEDPDDIVRALRAGFKLASSGKGEENARYAREHWNFGRVADLHDRLYRSLVPEPGNARLSERHAPRLCGYLPFGNCAETICDRLDAALRVLPKGCSVMCVNCGSTDGTEAYVRYYARNDDRIRLGSGCVRPGCAARLFAWAVCPLATAALSAACAVVRVCRRCRDRKGR